MPIDSEDRSFLSPEAHPAHWARVVDNISAAVQPELERRAQVHRPLLILQRWARPTAALAATISAAAMAVLALRPETPATTSPMQESSAGSVGVAQAIGVPEPFLVWLEAGETPTIEEMLSAFPSR